MKNEINGPKEVDEARSSSLQAALLFAEHGEEQKDADEVVEDAVVFYSYLTRLPEGFAPATG